MLKGRSSCPLILQPYDWLTGATVRSTKPAEAWPSEASSPQKPLPSWNALKRALPGTFFSDVRSTVEGSAAPWGWFVPAGLLSLSPAQGTELAALNGISMELWLVLGRKRACRIIWSFSWANSHIFLFPIRCTSFICLSLAFSFLCLSAVLQPWITLCPSWRCLTRGCFPNYWFNDRQLEKYLIAGLFESKCVSWGQRTFYVPAVHSLWANIPSCASRSLVSKPWGRVVAEDGHQN